MVYIMIGFVLVVAIGLALCRFVRWRDVGLLALFGLALALIFTANEGQQRDGPDNEVIINGTGRLVSRVIPVAEFGEIETDLAISLDVRQGDQYRVVFTADDTLIDYLQVMQEGTSLTLDLDSRFAYELLGVTMRAEITVPEPSRLRLDVSSRTAVSGLQSLAQLEAEG